MYQRFPIVSKHSFFIYALVAVSSFGSLKAQRHEIGVGLGAIAYTGDLIRTIDPLTSSPAVAGFYRYHFDNVLSLRANLMGGFLRGEDAEFDSFSSRRKRSFGTGIVEFSTVVEYNFLDYRPWRSGLRWTPFFYAGLGVFVKDFFEKPVEGTYSSVVQPVIPFGIGFKFLHRRQWTIGIDIGARKTFFDYIDEVSDKINDPAIGLVATVPDAKNYQYANPNDNDWYYGVGFTISYTFYRVDCKFPYQPFKSLPPGK